MNIWMLVFPYGKIIKEDWKYLSITQGDLLYGILNIFTIIILLSFFLGQYDISLISFIFLLLFIFSKQKGFSFLGGSDIPFIISLIFLGILYGNIQVIFIILSFTIIPYTLLYYFTRTKKILKNSKNLLLYINKTGEIDSLLKKGIDLTTFSFKNKNMKNKKIKDISFLLFKKLIKRIPFLPYLIFLNLITIFLIIITII